LDAFALAAKLTLDSKGFERDLGKSEKTFKSFGSSLKNGFKNAAKVAAVGIGAAATAVVGFAKSSVEAGMQFDATMSQVAAISGATGKEFDSLRAKAQEMGAKTKFSASESAEAFTYMAMAGWKTGDMLDGIEGLMNLAAASGESLAITSDIVTDALTAFGLSASDSGHFADVLAAASSNANTNVSMMGETFKYAAPLAGSLGFSIEDTALAIGLMANAGIKASQAGTSLRMIMTQTSQDFVVAGESIGEYTVKTQNADGTMRSLRDILSDSRQAFSQLSEAEKVAAAESIAGKNAMSGWLALMNASDEDFEKLSSAIDNCAGSAEEMAAIMQDNLQGDLIIFKSALEGAQIALSDQLTPAMREFVQFGTKSVAELTEAFKKDGLNGAMEALGGIIAEGTTKIVEGIPSFVDAGLKLFGAIVSGLVSNLPAIATAAKDIVDTLISNLQTFLDTNFPALGALFGTVTTAISGVTDALKGVFDKQSQNTEFQAAMESAWGAIETVINGVNTILETILSTFGSVFATDQEAASFQQSTDTTWGAIKGVFDTVSGAINAIIEAFTSVFGQEEQNTAFSTVVQDRWGLINTAISGVSTAITTVIDWFTKVFQKDSESNTFSSALDKSFGVVSSAIGLVSTAIETVIGWFTDVFNQEGPANAFSTALDSAWNLIETAIGAVSTAIETVITWMDNVFGKVDAGNIFGTALETSFGLVSAAIDLVSTAIETVIGWFESVFSNEDTANAYGTALESVWGMINTAIGAVSTAIETVISWFNNVFDKENAANIFGTALQTAFGLISTAADAISKAIETVIGWFESVFSNEETANAYGTALESVWNLITTAIGSVSTAIETVIGWFTSLFNNQETGDLFGSALQAAFGLISGAADLISTAIKTVIGWFTDLFGKDSLASAFGTAIKNAFQFVIDAANAISSAIETAVGWLASLFGYDGKSVNTTSNHTENTYEHTYHYEHWESDSGQSYSGKEGKFASAMSGGKILRNATVFGFNDRGPMIGGEAGPEAIVGVNSLDQMIANSVEKGFSSIINSLASINSGNKQPIYVMLDTGELVGAIGGKMDTELSRIGDWKGGGRA